MHVTLYKKNVGPMSLMGGQQISGTPLSHHTISSNFLGVFKRCFYATLQLCALNNFLLNSKGSQVDLSSVDKHGSHYPNWKQWNSVFEDSNSETFLLDDQKIKKL